MINPLDYDIYLDSPERLDSTSAWNEHIPFGMFLVARLRPRVLVELGTHTGTSYCAFCQAIKRIGLETRSYAVDTWSGDDHAGYYGSNVLSDLRAYHDQRYGSFSRLVQSTFDDASGNFEPGSIDLLHIDGLHTYEAVKHDFENWLPKLSDCAVVLFHDTNVRERGFGVWRFWLEVKQKYPSFEFFHGHGLGILLVGRKPVPALNNLFSMADDQAKQFRDFFFALGSHLTKISDLDNQIVIKDRLIHMLSVQNAEKDLLADELKAVYATRGWRLILFLRQIKNFILPDGSLQALLLRSIYQAVLLPIIGARWLNAQRLKLVLYLERLNEHFRLHGWRYTLRKVAVKLFSGLSRWNSGWPVQGFKSGENEQPEMIARLLLQPLRGFSVPLSEKRVNLVLERFDDSFMNSSIIAAVIFSTLLSQEWKCALRIITRLDPAKKSKFSEIIKQAGITASNVDFVFVPAGDSGMSLPVGPEEYFVALSWEIIQSLQSDFNLSRVFYLLHEKEKQRISAQPSQQAFEDIFSGANVPRVIAIGKPLRDWIATERKLLGQQDVVWLNQPSSPKDWSSALNTVVETIDG